MVNFITQFRARIGVQHIYDATILQRESTRAANFYELAGLCEIFTTGLLVDCPELHDRSRTGNVTLCQSSCYVLIPPKRYVILRCPPISYDNEAFPR